MSTESGPSPTAPDPAVLAGALGQLPLAVVLVDSEGHAIWSNDVTSALAADHDDGLRRLLEAVEDAVAEHRPEDGGAVMALPTDRGLVERELWIGPVDGGGHLVSFHPEVAARTVAERAAVGHTARLEAMLENTHDLVTVIDAEGTVQLSNAAAGRLTGFAGGSVNGTDAFSLVHPDDLGAAGAALAAVLAQPGVHPPVEVRIRFADGTWHDVVATPHNLLAVPGVEGIVLSMHDVTDRKRAEAQAAKSTAYLQSLIENLTDVIVVLDGDFNVLWTSPALATIIHAPVETNIGQSAFNDIHPDDLGPAITALTGVASGPLGGVTKVELRLESRPGSGSWRWIEATAVNRLRDPDVGGIVCTLRDVSDAKAAEEEIRAAFERERRAADRLRELDVLKDQFLASVSHEMRTPLAIIIGFADLLGRDDLGVDVQGEAIERIRASATEMRGMVENLLDHSALEAGKLTVRLRSIPVRSSVEATAGTLRSMLVDHPVGIEITDDLAVVADADGLDRVLRNLLVNAAKYSERGRPITVRASPEGAWVVLEVTDQGVGIPEDQLGLVFERLYRAPGAAFVARGTGVGLNMVRRYAELMGGSVSVESSVGSGSTFRVRLPLA